MKKKKVDTNQDEMVLRSKKVQKLIGEIPSTLVCWSTIIIITIFVILICALTMIEYPYGQGEKTILQQIINSK